jgi:DNA primase
MNETAHQSLLHALLECHGTENAETLRARVSAAVGRPEIEKLMSSAHIAVLPAIKQPDNDALAIETLAEQLAKLNCERSLRREIEEAEGDMEGLVDEGLTWRLMKAADARNRAIKLNLDEMNEAGDDRAALSAQLQQLIDSEVWVKRRGPARKPEAGRPTDPVIRPDDSLEPPDDDSDI